MRYFIFAFLICASCKIDRDREVDRNKFTFKTGDDTEIFFKNMRQSNYDLEENKAARFNVFRHTDRTQEADYPLLNLAIVVNYIQDEAYLLLEPNDYLRNMDTIEIFYTTEPGERGSITLEHYNREAMLEFASKIYEGLIKQAQFYIKNEGDQIPVLENPDEREAFRVTVADYYRLTRVF